MIRSESIELSGSLTVNEVPDVRRFVEKMHRRIVNANDASRVAVATHELLENAIKFSTDGSTSLRVEIGGSRVTITTRNRARPNDLEELRQIARDLAAALDPILYYLERMKRPSTQLGGLGLGRVAAEAEMKIELELDGDLVQIRAETTLGL